MIFGCRLDVVVDFQFLFKSYEFYVLLSDTKDEVPKEGGGQVMWEYKKEENSTEIKGPYTSEQMDKWAQSGHFGKGVFVRKCGTDRFYTSSRIDFDLYI